MPTNKLTGNLLASARRFKLTLGLSLVAIFLSCSDQLFTISYFDISHIKSGEHWRLLTGHLTHTSVSHLSWDLVAFTLASGYLERQSRTVLCFSLFAGIATVNLLLLSPLAEIGRYAGLSGILFAPLSLALIHFGWRQQTFESWIPAIICLGKLISEQVTGMALITDTHWPPYPAAHIAGLVGGITLLLSSRIRTTLFQRESGT